MVVVVVLLLQKAMIHHHRKHRQDCIESKMTVFFLSFFLFGCCIRLERLVEKTSVSVSFSCSSFQMDATTRKLIFPITCRFFNGCHPNKPLHVLYECLCVLAPNTNTNTNINITRAAAASIRDYYFIVRS